MAHRLISLPARRLSPWTRLPVSPAGWAVLVLMVLAVPASAAAIGYGLPALVVILLSARLFAGE